MQTSPTCRTVTHIKRCGFWLEMRDGVPVWYPLEAGLCVSVDIQCPDERDTSTLLEMRHSDLLLHLVQGDTNASASLSGVSVSIMERDRPEDRGASASQASNRTPTYTHS